MMKKQPHLRLSWPVGGGGGGGEGGIALCETNNEQTVLSEQ